MAKNKSKKKKKADFQKTKLKVGKKLSKGDNVTNLSFKTRQIHLTQSIRTGDTSQPVTRKNLSIQDLLRQCDHHSVGARVGAVSGIKELVLNNFDEFLVPSNVHGYGAIIKKLSSMLIDNESDVRHAVINLLKLMFNKLRQGTQHINASSLMSGALFSHIHAFLCCAMTHIYEDVRMDALILFDALLEAFPHAMVQQTGDLMKNLISMISAPMTIGAKGNTVTQRLSMNPESKLPIMKFRARVLLRIKLTLQVALLDLSELDSSHGSHEMKENKPVWSLYFDKFSEGSKQDTMLVSQNCASRFSWILKGTASEMQDYIIKPSSLEEFIRVSVPVLLQCWKEARASGPNETVTDNMLSSEALEVMSLVVSVIELLFRLSATTSTGGLQTLSETQMIPTSFLVENYESQFTQDFMGHFPYSASVETKQPKKRKLKGQPPVDNTPTQSSLASMNLCICHVMSCLCSNKTNHKKGSWLSKIQHFVVRSFNSTPSADHTRILIQIIMNIFRNPSLVEYFASAFEAACNYYTTCKVKYIQKKELFTLFALVLKQWDGWRNKSSDNMLTGRYLYSEKMEQTISKFVKSLPKLLLRIPRADLAHSEWMKDVVSCISFTMNGPPVFSVKDEFSQCLVEILDTTTGLLVVNDEDLQQKVLSLLAQGPALDKNLLKQVLLAMRRPATNPTLPHRRSNSLACQAITCVSLGIRRNIPFSSQVEFNQITSTQSDLLSDYLKFMFSILLGMSREELELLSPASASAKSSLKRVKYDMEMEQWNRHLNLVNIACQELMTLQVPASQSDGYHDPLTFITNIEQLWKHTLGKYGEVHIISAHSLFKFIHSSSMDHVRDKPSAELYRTTAHVMTCVLVSFYLPEIRNGKVNKEVIQQVKVVITACLSCVPPLLPDVCRNLKSAESSNTSHEEKKAAAQAMEFLLSDDRLKARITNAN